MVDLRPDGYVGTPASCASSSRRPRRWGGYFVAEEALVSGEALPGVTRTWLAERGITARQCYATADIGAIGCETEAEEGLVVEEELLVEIVRPVPAIRSSPARSARWWSPPSTRITR